MDQNTRLALFFLAIVVCILGLFMAMTTYRAKHPEKTVQVNGHVLVQPNATP